MKKRQIKTIDGSEFTVFYLKKNDTPAIKQPSSLKEKLEQEEKSLLSMWFWGKLKNKNYE